ncbi:MAG: bifunctional metallophosphatase/5-nucleotidase [Pseudonocardiales bacterium]|nr:bifunctional metallophosphatase/5-nucleotidase [Pseudonocardiales bacterium]
MKSTRSIKRTLAIFSAAVIAVTFNVSVAGAHPGSAAPIPLRIIAFNDFHGNLQPPAGSSGRVTLADATTVDAGGAAYMATHVSQLRSQAANSLLISAGDNIGASPLPSALFHDEPTIAFLNALHVDASATGNHEFDEGYQELMRIQFGGCHPTDGCQFTPTYPGAKFPFLGTNVYKTNGARAILPFTIKYVQGTLVGIIGATLEGVPNVVTPQAIAGLKFGEEVAAINQTSNLLQRLGVRVQIVTIHQGDEGLPGGGPNGCNVSPGEGTRIAKMASPNIDVFLTAHTHAQYNCTVIDPAGKPRPMISGLSFGRLLSVIDLKIDRQTRDVDRAATVAHNEIVTRTVTPDPTVQAIVDSAVTKEAPIGNRPVGSITADLVATQAASGESPLGDVIADAQLAATATNKEVIAITNPGGIRTNLNFASSPAGEGAGVVTYAEAFAVQPFSNIMQTITLSGAQLKAVLEQQWQVVGGVPITRFLQISASLHYSWSQSATDGSHISNITVNGTPVAPAGAYRVSINNFLAAGGDGFTVFAQGTNLAGGPIDLDAFTEYLTAHPHLAPPAADRITIIA